MYNDYWKLKDKPFENTPDPRFLYWSKQHEEALSRMLYVVKERKGAALISGEYGSGKTVLSRELLNRLPADQYQVALLLNPMLSPSALIKEIIHQLGGTVSASAAKAVVYNKLNELLVAINQSGKMAVVIVDEAQSIRNADFEEFRLMLNFQLNNSFLLSLVLLGQPELNAKINKLPQLKQRFALRFHLNALSEDETKEYILRRLQVAGDGAEIFDAGALAGIYKYTLGIPRMINNVCDLALLEASGEGIRSIDGELIKKIVADFEGKGSESVEPKSS
jgi:general secretion pathway protein A